MMQENSLEEKVVCKLKERGFHIVCAESCTGGMLTASLVNVAGVSEVLEESYVTYANASKHKLLGVSEEDLRIYGAVSRQVARQMAEGAAKESGAEAAIAVTGIAGPDGGSPEKPVGLVYIGCKVCEKIIVTENHFQGNRMEIRQQTVQKALALLLDCL